MKTTANLGEWLSKAWAPIGVILGAITAIIQFIQLWKGDQETITQVLWVVGAIIVWISLFHLGFSRSVIWIPVSSASGVERREHVSRYNYGEKLSAIARILFFLSFIVVIILWGITIRRNSLLEGKVVVLIADFDGPDPKRYRVTEQLLSQLSDTLSDYNDTVIIPLGETITEQEDSKKAHDLGKNYHADLVIWGWYGVTESDVLLTVHVENLSDLDYLPLMSSNLYSMQLPAYEIQSFQIQQRFSSEMTALTLFLGGLIRYEANDYQGAIQRFTEALNEKWPDDIVSKKFLFFYRGQSYMSVRDGRYSYEHGLTKAVEDFSKAIELDSGFLGAYYFRIISYVYLGEFSNATKDYQLFMAQDFQPTDADGYHIVGYLAFMVGDITKATEYLNIAIEMDPDNAPVISIRGTIYSMIGEEEKALEDENRAIQLEPNFWGNYLNRAGLFQEMEEYELALKDINHALDLQTDNDAVEINAIMLATRGRIYMDMNQYTKALEDFSTAIQLSPMYYYYYYERGTAYLKLEEFELAIQEFSTYIYSIEIQNDYFFDYFFIPNAYYSRGVALEKLGYSTDALRDYSFASQAYTDLAKSYYDQGYSREAKILCKTAIQNFQDLADNSENDSIVKWSDSVVESFTLSCPNSLVKHIPTKNWLVELAINPIILGSGLAGINTGDTFSDVVEKLGEPKAAVAGILGQSNNSDCCMSLVYFTDELVFQMIFSSDHLTDLEVLGFRLDALKPPREIIFIPYLNNTSLGTTEEELLSHWGNPVAIKEVDGNLTEFSIITKESIDCSEIYYSGITFGVCESKGDNERLVYYIEVPNIDN